MSIETTTVMALLRESLDQGHQPLLTLTSNSLAPLLHAGDQVKVAPASWRQLCAGDLVVYRVGDQLVTHRFWGVAPGSPATEPWLVSRGDRSLSFDRPWPAAALIGRVVACRYGRRDLKLDRGAGRWLNHRLSSLAGRELAWFARWHRAPGLTSLPGTDGSGLPFHRLPRRRLRTAVIRRLVRAGAAGLIACARIAALLEDQWREKATP